jgi:hypothetical protein
LTVEVPEMSIQVPPITPGSLPPTPLPPTGYYCDCREPMPEQRAERRGAARTYCTRCERELPLRIGRSA